MDIAEEIPYKIYLMKGLGEIYKRIKLMVWTYASLPITYTQNILSFEMSNMSRIWANIGIGFLKSANHDPILCTYKAHKFEK